MSKIPKEIVDKIEQRKALNEEIAEWCRENLDIDGMNSDFADITDYHTGGEQGRERAYALWNWYRLPEWIIDIAERLRMVQIENRPAVEVIERFNYSNVFMYIDPPYVLGTRTGKQYKHEMSDSDHEELLKLLLQSKAKIMLSGYESEMYNDYLNGWEKKQFSSCAEHGKPRMETVWMNYEPDPQMKLNFSEVLS